MSFSHLPTARPAPRRTKQESIFCVGWRAFVNWHPPAGQASASVPLVDPQGHPLANDLTDGQEVEILSWQPRARDGTCYHVRRLADGTEWWINALYLRRQFAAVAGPAMPGATGRRDDG